jgi:hypothetical protein
MAKTRNEREDDERQERLEEMREQVSSRELVVRLMTASERRHWEEHSAPSMITRRRKSGLGGKRRGRSGTIRRTANRNGATPRREMSTWTISVIPADSYRI